jgi:hypothetical protein
MTEGLAVYQEHAPLRWDWVPMLYNAVKKNELFPLDDLTWAFIRPKKKHHRTLAYAQSYWVCKYVEQTYGHDAHPEAARGFKAGGRQEDLFPEGDRQVDHPVHAGVPRLDASSRWHLGLRRGVDEEVQRAARQGRGR